MPDVSDSPAQLVAAVDKAVEGKIRSAQRVAMVSVAVAAMSLAGTSISALLTYRVNVETAEINAATEQKLQEMSVRVEMSGLAIDRASTVAAEYEKLLDREGKEGVNKRLAFLNLWHLYEGMEDRKLLILMASQYAADDVFELMLVLASELSDYEDLIASLTHRRECLDEISKDGHGCYKNEFAKQLLSKLAPDKAMEILLQAMSAEPLTSPNDANLEILRLLIAQNPDKQKKLREYYETQYSGLVGLSYLLYAYGTPEPFRAVLGADLPLEKKGELVEFLSGWPLSDLEAQDRQALIAFLIPLLTAFDTEKDQLLLVPVISTVKKIRRDMTPDQITRVGERLADFVARDDLSWPIRSIAAEVLASADLQGLIVALRDVNVDDQPLMAEDFARAMTANRRHLTGLYSTETIPASDQFSDWQAWIKEISHE